jgi:hypothetical protein
LFVDLDRRYLGHFQLSNSERTSSATKREDSALAKAVPADASALQDNEQRSPIQPATRVQRIKALWPWAFLAFAGVITLAWAIGLGWAAFAFVRWLVGF